MGVTPTNEGTAGRPLRSERRVPTWVAVLVALLVALGAAYVIAELRGRADEANRAVLAFKDLDKQAYRLSALEWQATAERRLDDEVDEEAREAYTDSSESLEELGRLEAQSEGLSRVRRAYRDFSGATKEQFRLLAAGDVEGALAVDEERVDPSFEAFGGELKDAGEEYGALARWQNGFATAGSVLTLLVAAVVVGALFRWGGRARRAAQLLETEQRVWRESEKLLRHQALHDPLTGLPNRALLVERLGQALARTERRGWSVGVLFMDLDNFKVVNDSLGHKAGDRLLVEVAGRLREGKRPEDTVARLGGDEFVVLLEDLDDEFHATRAAERLVERLRAPFEIGGQEVYAEASVGVALGACGDDADDLLRSADIAMYRAKHGGKGRVRLFDRDMDAEARERLKRENDLRRALERGEFVLHYQPEVLLDADLQQRLRLMGKPAAVAARAPKVEPRVVAMEALVRWEHPERGLVAPAEFIPLAEETGLIVPLGRWVLQEACRQAKEWREQYPDYPLMMAVNVSARQFQHPDLVAWIEEAANHAGLAPGNLLLEITESVLMEDAEHNKVTLEKLKGLGVALAIDDFGTGYSSLAYLRRFSVDYLKIDRSFTHGMGRDSENKAIVLGMIGLAHAVGLKTVAEGVEYAEQLAQLRAMRCDMAQGYHFARPMPREGASEFLAKRFGVGDGAEPKHGPAHRA